MAIEEFVRVPLKNVYCSIAPEFNSVGAFHGMTIKFDEKNRDQIFMLSNKEIIREFPGWLKKDGFTMDIKNFILFFSIIEAAISPYIYNIRKSLDGDLVFNVDDIGGNRFAKIFVNKHFTRVKDDHGERGRYKIEISFFTKDENFGVYEDIRISLTKRDVLMLREMIRLIGSQSIRTSSYILPYYRANPDTLEPLPNENRLASITKIGNALLIGDVWLHGQEIMNLMYLCHVLSENFNIIDSPEVAYLSYRQISVVREGALFYLVIKKMNDKHEEVPMYTDGGERYVVKIPVSALLIAYVNAFVSIKMLKHAIDHLGTFGDTSNPFVGKDVRYHISMIESYIGFGATNHNKLLMNVKINYDAYMKNQVKDTNSYVDTGLIMDEFSVALSFPNLIKMVTALTAAYNRDYASSEKNYSVIRFFQDTQDDDYGLVRYEFLFHSDVANKASIMKVNKYSMIGRRDKGQLIGTFRQPIFHKYIFMIIHAILASASDIPIRRFLIKSLQKNILKYKYTSMLSVKTIKHQKEIYYGISRDGENVIFGVFDSKNKRHEADESRSELLTQNDVAMLFISSKTRIMTGKWLPFTGDMVAINPDRYITDQFGEHKLFSEQLGEYESMWAAGLCLSTCSD